MQHDVRPGLSLAQSAKGEMSAGLRRAAARQPQPQPQPQPASCTSEGISTTDGYGMEHSRGNTITDCAKEGHG